MKRIFLIAFLILLITSTVSQFVTAIGVGPIQPSPVQYVPGEVIVGLKDADDRPMITRLIEGKGGTIIRRLDTLAAVVVKVSEERVEAFMEKMRESSWVRYVERNGKVMLTLTPNDPGWSNQWGPKKIQADTAWNTQTGDKSILVAVVDTGVDWNHPDLAANYVALGYDWWNDDSDPMDDHGHGTHVAGIIAAVLNNGKGIAGLAQVRVMAEKFLSAEGWGTYADAASALIHATDAGADIISNSWGSYQDSSLVHDAVKYAYNKGALLVAAAGNEGWDWPLYPAAYDEVVAVTATDQSDNPASFTNFGSWVEVAAPGVSIYSTVWDDSYASWSGTSMATPHAAGVAALIWSQFPSMTRDQVRARLRSTADDLGNPGFDIYYGYGRINARKAVGTSPPSAPSGLTATAVSSSQINLAWTDNSADESDFHIERKEGSGGTWSEIKTVGVNTISYQDTGLRPSTIYYYRVRAHRHSDNLYSGYSNEASATTSGGAFQYQAGKVNADHNWATVSFPSSFSTTPVIVAAIMTENDGDNCHIDLRNPSTTGFQARVEEDKSRDGSHATEVIGWFATLPGTYTVDGKKVIAGTITADHQWKQVNFPSSFSSTPVIVATIMSESDGDNSHIDLRNPSATGFQVRVEEDTSCDGRHTTENIGWIALEPGTYNINSVKLIAGKVNANHNWATVSFPSSFSSTPTIVAEIMTENGGDNCHVDLRNPSASGFQARVEEDIGCDGPHTTETIGWIAIQSGSGNPVNSLSVGLVSPNDGASLTSSPIQLRARVTSDGSAVQGASVNFYVDGSLKGTISSDSNGYSSYNFYPPSAKTYTWYAIAKKSGYNPGTSETWGFTYSPSGGAFRYQAGKISADHNWATVSFPSSFGSAPVIVAAIMTENDGDNSHIDLRNPSATGFQVRVEEDTSCDGRHVTETIGWLAVESGVYVVDGKKIIAGTTTADHQWKQVTFPSSFSDTPVIVAVIMTENGGDNCHIDLRNPSASGFQVRVEEDVGCDGPHTTETIGWIALEPGTYNINGAKLIAGKVNADHNWATVSFPSTFSSTPAIVAAIMTENGGDNCHIDLRSPSVSGFQARVEEDKSCDGRHATETIGWIAIESGSG